MIFYKKGKRRARVKPMEKNLRGQVLNLLNDYNRDGILSAGSAAKLVSLANLTASDLPVGITNDAFYSFLFLFRRGIQVLKLAQQGDEASALSLLITSLMVTEGCESRRDFLERIDAQRLHDPFEGRLYRLGKNLATKLNDKGSENAFEQRETQFQEHWRVCSEGLEAHLTLSESEEWTRELEFFFN